MLRITKIAEGWSHTVFTPALEATTSKRTFGKLPSVNCYLARGNIHDAYAMAVVDTARFTSSLAAATLEDGMTLDSGPWGLGNYMYAGDT